MKVKFLIIVFLLSLLGCASEKNTESFGFVEDANPTNSILVYGSVEPAFKEMEYVQINSEKNPCFIKLKSKQTGFSSPYAIIFPPLEAGGTYKLVYAFKKNESEKAIKDYEYKGNLNEMTEWDFTLPEEPGLYYIGLHNLEIKDVMNFSASGAVATIENEYSEGISFILPSSYTKKKQAEYELDALKVLLKEYKGTDWEDLIYERMEVLENEK